jgi:hypothetical protein
VGDYTDGFDYGQLSVLLIGIVLGSSGIVGWILTYLQLRREKTERALRQFREFVLTPDFLEFLGVLRHMADLSAKSEVLLRAEQEILSNKSLTEEDRIRQINELEDETGHSLSDITEQRRQMRVQFTEKGNKIKETSAFFLLPDKIEDEINDCLLSLAAANEPEEYRTAISKVEKVFSDIKSILGLNIFE